MKMFYYCVRKDQMSKNFIYEINTNPLRIRKIRFSDKVTSENDLILRARLLDEINNKNQTENNKHNITFKELCDLSIKNNLSLKTYRDLLNNNLFIDLTSSPGVAVNIKKLDVKYKDLLLSLNDSEMPFIFGKLVYTARNLMDNNIPLYKHFQIPKKDGKLRDIYAPNKELKEDLRILNRLYQHIFNNKKKTNQYAYIKNRNIKDNANVHRNNQYMIKIDIKSFFTSTKFKDISSYIKLLFPNLHYSKNRYIFNSLKKILVDNTNGLYMGNPISGTLTNLVMHKVILYLNNILKKKNIIVSIYADDICFSCEKPMCVKYLINVTNYVFKKYKLEYEIKPEKTVIMSKCKRYICGIVINHDNKLTIRRKDYELARNMLYRLSKGQNITIPISTLMGRLNYYKYIDETDKINKLMTKYQNVINQYS